MSFCSVSSSLRILGFTASVAFLLLVMAGVVLAAPEASEGPSALFQESASPTPTLPVGTFAPPVEPTVTAVPPYAASVMPPEGHDVLNVLLLGSDTDHLAAGRTDALMIASLNRTAGTASLLSLPRDLFVYVPGWTMQRINTVFAHGEQGGYEGGGYQLLKDTILYNLGIPIHFYAHVDFGGFRQIVDALGGVELTVDCTLEDWRLISPDLDPAVEENWELFTLPVGVHQMDGDLALWYARSRRTTTDFDRGLRQQQLMQAIWRRLVELGLLNQLPDLWGQVTEVVTTDMQLQDLVGLIPLALTIDSNRIAHYTFRAGEDVRSWRTPQGASVQLPVPERVRRMMYNFMQPPTVNRLVQGGPTVEVLNASNVPGLDRVAADRLAWEGFAAMAGGEDGGAFRPVSVVYDYTGQTKGSAIDVLLAVLRLTREDVIVEPDPNRTVDYRVVLGGSYRSCAHNVALPEPSSNPIEAAAASPAQR
jgi:LCP family protein required for cell wall assembly